MLRTRDQWLLNILHQINRFFLIDDFKNQQDLFETGFKIKVQDCYIQHTIYAENTKEPQWAN